MCRPVLDSARLKEKGSHLMPAKKASFRAFTLIELLVVIGVIALLIAILIPSISKAKQISQSTVCLSNLRQCGIATTMYTGDFRGMLPYPTTTLDTGIGDDTEPRLWFNAIDPYLQSIYNSTRSGVAGSRAYTKFKQCPTVYSFFGQNVNYGSTSGSQNQDTEYMRSYKMNSMLRHNNPYSQANTADVLKPDNFVLYGDGIGLDIVGIVENQYDNGQFSMEVDDTGGDATPPALRHLNGANIAFVDGHAEHESLPLLSSDPKATKLANSPQTPILRWPGEFIDASGKPYDPPAGATKLPAGTTLNPNMPLQWSEVGNLYR